MIIMEINPEHPQPRKVETIREILAGGGIVAYPTDTVYGIGCDINNRKAIDRLHKIVSEIKRSPKHSPLSFICPDLSDIARYAHINNNAYRIMRRLLPGPYTFVLEANKRVPKIMVKKRKTIGIRVPDNAIALEIVSALGNPMATTSATMDDELIPDPWTIKNLYGHAIDAIIDGGYIYPEPSTVIDFTQDIPLVIREGKGPVEGFDYAEEESDTEY